MTDGAWQAPERLSAGAAVDGGGDHRHRRRPAGDRVHRRRRRVRHRDPRGGPAPAPGGPDRRRRRAPGWRSTWASTTRPTPCGRSRERTRRARGAAGGDDVDAASPRRWTSTPGGRRAPAPRARGSRSAPRATPWSPGARPAPTARTHVYARRLTGLNPSVVPAGPHAGRSSRARAAGSADSPDIDIEDDGSFAWVVFRQDVGGRSRSIARRLLGSQFEAPAAIDGGADERRPADRLRRQGDRRCRGGDRRQRRLQRLPGQVRRLPARRAPRRDGGRRPRRGPVVATSERGRRLRGLAVAPPTAAGRSARAARTARAACEPEFQASNPAFGAVAPGPGGDRRRPLGQHRAWRCSRARRAPGG